MNAGEALTVVRSADQPGGGGSSPAHPLVEPVELDEANAVLEGRHYLGPSRRGWALQSAEGVLVFANPSSRWLPQKRWVELVRWCLVRGKENDGSRQWAAVRRWLQRVRPDLTTVVSYSDPSAGHEGALYRACNWLWAPTWHRLRPPPSGNGDWGSGRQATKDRWVFPLQDDEEREQVLKVKDAAVNRKMPWASYREGKGGDHKRFTERFTPEGGQ